MTSKYIEGVLAELEKDWVQRADKDSVYFLISSEEDLDEFKLFISNALEKQEKENQRRIDLIVDIMGAKISTQDLEQIVSSLSHTRV